MLINKRSIHLRVGFLLRCSQQFSIITTHSYPAYPTKNWYTRGVSFQVLSYYGRVSSILLRLHRIRTKLSHDVLNPAHVPL